MDSTAQEYLAIWEHEVARDDLKYEFFQIIMIFFCEWPTTSEKYVWKMIGDDDQP